MAEKMTCPACNARLSDIRRAFLDGEPCPNCGLSADAAREIEAIRMKRGDEKLKADLEAALIRAGKAETEAARLRRQLDHLRYVIEPALSEDWKPDDF